MPSFLTLKLVNKMVNIGDSDGECRMPLSSEWRLNQLAKRTQTPAVRLVSNVSPSSTSDLRAPAAVHHR